MVLRIHVKYVKLQMSLRFLEENTRVNLHDVGFDNEFLDRTSKACRATNINKLDFIKIKNFCASEITIKKVRGEPTKWEKTFATDIPDKGLVSKIYEEL